MPMIDVDGEMDRAARRAQMAGKPSVRTRLKAAQDVARHYAKMTEALADANGRLQFEFRVANTALGIYSKRWRKAEIALALILAAVLASLHV